MIEHSPHRINSSSLVQTNQLEHQMKKRNGKVRGDPRMHKAVAARLANPELSLLQALVIGGFKFPDDRGEGKCDRNIYDSDHVLLCQRKNQLSRRLRLVRRQNAENSSVNNVNKSLGTNFLSSADVQFQQMQAMCSQYRQTALHHLSAIQKVASLGNNPFHPGAVTSEQQYHSRASSIPASFNQPRINPSAHQIFQVNQHELLTRLVQSRQTKLDLSALTEEVELKRIRLQKATNIYRVEQEQLKKRSLLLAGFHEEEISYDLEEDFYQALAKTRKCNVI